jgi:hypothetical protein
MTVESWQKLWSTPVEPKMESKRTVMLIRQAYLADDELACLAGLLRSTHHLDS